MLTLISVSGKWKVWGFLFAYTGSVVVSMQVCHAQDSGLSPHGVKTECLNFTYDCPELASGDGMPVLDTEMWIQTEQRDQGIPEQILPKYKQNVKPGQLKKVVVYKFFKKPMADTTPNLSRNAAPVSQRISQ